MVRNTYPDLKNTTVKTWKDWWGDSFGPFLNVAPFVHHMRYDLDDKTKVDCEVIFLAVDDEEDAKKFLSLELTGIYFNEVRELKRAVVEAGDGRLGRYPSMKDGGPTWYGMIADTNMPDEDHWIYDLAENRGAGHEGWEFYKQPGGVIKVDGQWIRNPTAENTQNLTPDYYAGQVVGKSDEWIKVHLGAEYGRLSTEGAYFSEEMEAADREGRITDLLVSPDLPVHTFWDIGMHDYMCIWFGQNLGTHWNWLHYYENNGKAIDHYAGYLTDFKNTHRVVFGDHVWPHDGAHRDIGIVGAKTRAEVFAGFNFKAPIILPRRANPGEWIDATRQFLRKSKWDRTGCKTGLLRIRRYSKRFDPVRNVYLKEPLHDEHSHGADAFQVAAKGHGQTSNNSAEWGDEIMNFEFKYAG